MDGAPARLRRSALFSSSASDDRITFEVPLPSARSRRRSTSLRELLGRDRRVLDRAAGRGSAWTRATASTGAPLFTGEAVTDARDRQPTRAGRRRST